jgi:hypothetical protein
MCKQVVPSTTLNPTEGERSVPIAKPVSEVRRKEVRVSLDSLLFLRLLKSSISRRRTEDEEKEHLLTWFPVYVQVRVEWHAFRFLQFVPPEEAIYTSYSCTPFPMWSLRMKRVKFEGNDSTSGNSALAFSGHSGVWIHGMARSF